METMHKKMWIFWVIYAIVKRGTFRGHATTKNGMFGEGIHGET